MLFTSRELSGFAILEQYLKEMERIGVNILPSLNHFLEINKLYMTSQDIRALRKLLKTTKYKIVKTIDYQIIPRKRK